MSITAVRSRKKHTNIYSTGGVCSASKRRVPMTFTSIQGLASTRDSQRQETESTCLSRVCHLAITYPEPLRH